MHYKEVFYKYFQKIFATNILSDYQSFEIYSDQLISEAFKKEMYDYLDNNLGIQTLFSSYEMVDDKDEVLVQLADLVAGSLGRVFSPSHYVNQASDIVEILLPKMTPPEYFPYRYEAPKLSTSIDKTANLITRFVLKDVIDYINNSSNPIELINVLKFLYFSFKVNPKELVDIHSMHSSLSQLHKDISIDHIRTYIRDLRYEGILIVSVAGRKGYKLARDESDIKAYFSHYLNYLKPMLKKMEVANNKLKKIEKGDNLIDSQEFLVLKQLINVSEKF